MINAWREAETNSPFRRLRMDYRIVGMRENPEYLERAIDCFAVKWGY
jgi:hypothetical protein